MATGRVDYKVPSRGYIVCYPLLQIFTKQADECSVSAFAYWNVIRMLDYHFFRHDARSTVYYCWLHASSLSSCPVF